MIGVRSRLSESGRVPTRMVADLVVLVAAAVVVVALSRAPQIVDGMPQPVTDHVVAVITAVAATGASVLGAIVARLDGDLRARWIGAAVVFYSFVVVPLTVFVVVPGDEDAQRGARLLAYLFTVGLLAVVARPPRRVGAVGTWSAVAACAVVTLIALRVPDASRLLSSNPVLLIVVAIGGAAGTAAVLVDAYRRLSLPWWRIGVGLTAVAGAQLYRIGAAGDPRGALTVDGLRLIGLLTVVAGLGQLSGRAVTEIRSEHAAQQEELVIAAVHMERASELAAERDHELRNGLAGLAGITHLLSLDEAGLEHERLRHAVLAELGRLSSILDSGASTSEDLDYRVEPVLAGLAILRRSAGAAVEVDLDPALRVRGDPAVLAQIVTNLLANCERHAPGARVVLRAFRLGDDAVVEVRDEGSGLPTDLEPVVLERGVQDCASGGSGLGLYISRRLVEREGGTLRVRSVDDPPGCLATVTVPRAEPFGAPTQSGADGP